MRPSLNRTGVYTGVSAGGGGICNALRGGGVAQTEGGVLHRHYADLPRRYCFFSSLSVHPVTLQRRGRGRERPPKKRRWRVSPRGGVAHRVAPGVAHPPPRLGRVSPVLIYPWREGPETTAGAGAPGAAVVRTTIQNGPTAGRFAAILAVDFRPGPRWNRDRSPLPMWSARRSRSNGYPCRP